MSWRLERLSRGLSALGVGYFWITLAAMIALYVGIYRIALGLHRRSVAQRERSIACLVSMAGGAVTQIGSAIGMTRTADGHGPPPPLPADTHAAAAVDPRHDDDDDDEDDDDDRATVETPHVASRLPALLLPATSFALFGRLGASKRHDTHVYSRSHKQTTAVSSPPVTQGQDTAAPTGLTVVKNKDSLSKSQSSAMSCSERSDRAADVSDEHPSATRRHKRDAASVVAARPEDLHDLPYFDDDDYYDDRPLSDTFNTANSGGKISETGNTQLSLNEQRAVRFVTATEGVTVGGYDTTPTHHEDIVLLKTSCNGGRRFAVQSSSSASSHFHQQHSSHTSGFASYVWRHVVVHKEGRHAESRLETSAEPDERQALLRASCPRHDTERKRLQQLTRNNHRTRKALRTITIILGAFMICWIPWHVLSLIIGFSCQHGTLSCPFALTLYDISYWVCYLNSPINPFCYAFANQQFKKAFIRIIRLDWRRS